MLSKEKLATIAKNAVEIGEWNNGCLGNCKHISVRIAKKLEELGYIFPEELYMIEPSLFIDGGYTIGDHWSVILPEQKLIIDTQLWQISRRKTTLSSRKVVFTYKEYKERGLSW